MSDLKQRLLKASVNKMTAPLEKSKLFNEKDQIKTRVPILNLALSGKFDGGLTSGLTVLAGPSKHFKSNMSLVMVSAYMKKYEEAICLFYDSEFGTTPEYLRAMGVDPERVIHTPIQNIEQLKFDMVNQLDALERTDKVIIFIDSIGNTASKKETEDAINEKAVADMSRAKQIKSLFRIITPYLTTKDIPCIAVAHTYETQEMFSKQVVSGGCVVGDTMIRMADNTLKAVQDITPGEYVKTMVGHSMVTHTWNPETLDVGEPDCYEIEFEDGHKVTCSDVHKFLIMDGDTPKWVMAKDLIAGMDNVVI